MAFSCFPEFLIQVFSLLVFKKRTISSTEDVYKNRKISVVSVCTVVISI